MPKIFISYRREDSKHAVGRLHAALKRHVRNPKRDIFMDIDNIPRGVDFIEHLDGQVAQCEVMLAVIGPQWATVRDPKTRQRRLDDPNDFVRIELAAALKLGIPVVPVVLDDTPIPSATELPEDVKALARRNGERLAHESFDTDVERLIRNLPAAQKTQASAAWTAQTKPRASTSSPSRGVWLAGIAGAAAVALVATLVVWQPWSTAPASVSAPAEPDLSVFADTGKAGIDPGQTPVTSSQPPLTPDKSGGSTPPLPDFSASPVPIEPVATSSAPPRAGETFRDCSDCPQMVSIPAGSFLMGSPASETGRSSVEGPQRHVSVPGFAAGRHEVTWTEYGACVSAGACPAAEDDGFGKGSRPVTNVSWNDAKKYATWLSSRTGKTYRLLSEAEWEYAARAGNQARWSFGDSESALGSSAWYGSNSGSATHPAGTKTANAFGLHDMHGNVWEWVEDCRANNYSSGQPSDGRAFTNGNCSLRVFRGGSWFNDPRSLRSANRYWDVQTHKSYFLGFRIARTL